jgi:hypothetical protein
MPGILIIYASDAEPVLGSFRAAFNEWGPVVFFEAEGSDRRLRTQLARLARNADVCLFLSSHLLFSNLRQLAPFRRYFSKSLAFRINLTMPTNEEQHFWGSLNIFRSTSDGIGYHPAFKGDPVLEMAPDKLSLRLRFLVGYLDSRFDRRNLSIHRFTSHSLEYRVESLRGPARAAPPVISVPDSRVVELLFATNRVSSGHPRINGFTGERAHGLSFGSSRVRVPDDHKIGHLELPKKFNWINADFRTSLRIQSVIS